MYSTSYNYIHIMIAGIVIHLFIFTYYLVTYLYVAILIKYLVITDYQL